MFYIKEVKKINWGYNMRIALLGGSFDPIHNGHLQIAKYALKQIDIDEVWFMPAYNAPLKNGQSASFKDRCTMVSMMISGYRKMKLCEVEAKFQGTSYTYNTIKYLKQHYPMHQFVFLMGNDQALHFHKWYRYEDLLKEVDFYVFSRDEDIELDSIFKQVKMPLIHVSSTRIRQGYDTYHVPKKIRRYIGEHRLYLKERIQSRMNEKRYLHSLSVADVCVTLAKAHHLNEEIAYTMGLCHDFTKYFDLEQSKIFMKYHEPSNISYSPLVWHGFQGAYEVKRLLSIHNSSIYHAIYHHVLGSGKSKYSKILFTADKIDPLRGYDISKQLSISMKDLNAGFELVKKEQKAFLKK